MTLDDANVVFPLASSYNVRGTAGYTNVVTNALDQRKINSIYEPIQNSLSGETRLYLAKRPGISKVDAGTYGVSGDVQYLITNVGSANNPTPWVILFQGTTTSANAGGASTTILNASNTRPIYVTETLISGVLTVVVQIRNTSTNVQRVFYASAVNSWTEISDADFTALNHRGMAVHLDGYMFIFDSQSRIWSSDLNTLATWSATSFISKQIEQDSGAGLARIGHQIVAFGDETAEVFYNAGYTTGSVLERIPNLTARVGLGSISLNWGHTAGVRHYYAQAGRRIYFPGRTASRASEGAIFGFDGSKFEKVSTPAIDKIITEATVYHVSTVLVRGKIGVAFSLTAPDTATQRALLFFPEWNEWFEWTSTYVQFASEGQFFMGIGGASSALKIARFETDATESWQDGTASSYQWLHQFKFPKKSNDLQRMKMFGLVGDTARSSLNVLVQFSDDDGQNWSTGRNIDMTSKRKSIHRNGTYRSRMVRLSHTGNLEVRLESALARVE
jgi:hypothetical protein